PLYTVIDVPHAEQVHFFYLAKVLSDELYPGPESLEAAFFKVEDIPWPELSFRTVVTTLEHYIHDLKTGVFPIHHYDIPLPPPK
ncbi:MAG TPA: NUDIX hydrolase, partial [Candidimonas sp.]|nr:NUDIX hydrolase [Candidimonas sp.]